MGFSTFLVMVISSKTSSLTKHTIPCIFQLTFKLNSILWKSQDFAFCFKWNVLESDKFNLSLSSIKIVMQSADPNLLNGVLKK